MYDNEATDKMAEELSKISRENVEEFERVVFSEPCGCCGTFDCLGCERYR